MATSEKVVDHFIRLRSDFEYYAPRSLKILTKQGNIEPMLLNRAQKFIHAALEKQKKATGKVRAIIVKGRQMGASTYIGARFYWLATGLHGHRVQILTHEIPATQNLFRMVRRFHDHNPAGSRPSTGNSSAIELVFDKLDTRYAIATAGAQATGRSATAQLFHGSEVAFWPNAEDHMAGIGQIVADVPGTEIILESTGNGIGNLFHGKVQDALRGRGDYILIFTPWFWDDQYRRAPPEGFMLNEDEHAYSEAYGLDFEQMCWRRAKIIDDFRSDEALFNQEYPATVDMAFQRSSSDSLILPAWVASARRARVERVDGIGALILGVDPAEYGDDDTAFAFRRGRKLEPIERHHGRGPMEIAGLLADRIEKRRPDATLIDVTGGYGRGILERLGELGFKRLYAVNFGERALDPELYVNRRAEMWGLMRDWIRDSDPMLPDDDVLASDLSAVTYSYDSSRRLVLTSKEKLKKLGVRSPDAADATALTFAMKFEASQKMDVPSWRQRLKKYRRGSGSAQSA